MLSAALTEKQLSLLRLFETAKQTKVCPNILYADAKRQHKRNKLSFNSAWH